MSGIDIDFETAAKNLLPNASSLIKSWLPNAVQKGNEFVCGNLQGDKGTSLSVNVNTGKWADFATGDKGGDLISLYAAINGVGQTEAARILSNTDTMPVKAKAKAKPRFSHREHGAPSQTWAYNDVEGKPMMYVARYDTNSGGKEFMPWTQRNDGRWVSKSIPAPRPLYRLNKLLEPPTTKPVMIVEGEKAADAAMLIVGKVYEVTTWPGGANAVNHADWSLIAGRKVLIWPDNDKAGVKAAMSVAKTLRSLDTNVDIKTIDVSDRPAKWDAADAEQDGWSWDQFKAWASEHAKEYKKGEVVQKSHLTLWNELDLSLNGSYRPYNDLDNACKVIEGMEELKGIVWFDEFHRKVFTTLDDNGPETWTDKHSSTLARYMQSQLGMRGLSSKLAREAAHAVAHADTRNEVRDWFDSLEWDKQERLPSLMSVGFKVDHSEYSQAVGRCWMTGMVARIYAPGKCKVDNMVIFEGDQGIGKSTALRILAGDKWFDECPLPVSHPDFMNHLEGKMIVDLGELSGFSKSDINHIKLMLSSQTFRYRKKYAVDSEDVPRVTTITGTTNTFDWNKDETGARRFWPVRCGDYLNIKWIKENRDQLFAESVARYKSGESWWDVPEGAARDEQDARFDHHPWASLIESYLSLNRGTEHLSIPQVMSEILGLEKSRWSRKDGLEVAKILRKLGWEQPKNPQRWDSNLNKTVRVFVPTHKAER